MAQKSSDSSKTRQYTLEEYAKVKEKLTKSKLKLTFPWIIRICFLLPLVYCLFLVVYYLGQVRFLAEH